MRSCQRAILLTLGVLAVLASTTQAQTTLRYQFKEGEKLQYVMDQKMKTAVSIMGKEIETKMNIWLEMTWTVGKVENGAAQLKIKVTHAKMSMDGPTGVVEVDSMKKTEADDPIGKIFGQIVKALSTMEISGNMLPTGDLKDIKVSEETVKALKNLPGADKLGDVFSPDQFKTMVSNLTFPTEAIKKGKSWTSKNEAKTPVGKTVTENTFTYEGSAEKDGQTLEKFSVKPNIKIEPDPAAQIEIKLKDVKANSTIWFDNKAGRMVETSGNQRMEMQLSANGLMFNQTVDQTITLRLKK
jgi:Family of unknown function (DUF6263)